MTPRRVIHADRLMVRIIAALRRGAQRRSAFDFEWHVAGRCLQPLELELVAYPDKGPILVPVYAGVDAYSMRTVYDLKRAYSKYIEVTKDAPRLKLTMIVRCRKCDVCRAERSAQWTARAVAEIALAAGRTWMGTLMVPPEQRVRMRFEVEKSRASQGLPALGCFDPIEQGKLLSAPISRELTLYLKRLRKNTRKQFRYLAAYELHKLCGDCKKLGLPGPCEHASYFPHWHILIIERFMPITKRELQEAWPRGWFTNFKLIDESKVNSGARYVTKYISKELVTRVRSSKHFGNPPPL